MTAINAMRAADAVYICTDSACYRGPIVTGFVSKTFALPHLNLVIAATGLLDIAAELFSLMREFESFDDAAERFGVSFRDAFEGGWFDRSDDPDPDANHLRFIIGGWSQTKGPRLYAISSKPEPGGEPFTMFEGQSFFSPNADPDFLRTLLPRAGGAIDPAAFLGGVVKWQRQHDQRSIGGAVVMTRIAKDDISQRVLWRWPDQIGERIDPTVVVTADEAQTEAGFLTVGRPKKNGSDSTHSPKEPEGLSRLQRERWEKRQRKLARRVEA